MDQVSPFLDIILLKNRICMHLKWHLSTLYGTTNVAYLHDVFKFPFMTEHLLLKLKEFTIIEFIFTLTIPSPSWCCSSCGSILCNILLLLLLQTSFEVVDFSHTAHLSICWASSKWMNGTTILVYLSHGCSVLVVASHFAFALCFL